jgi:hypothetical protein
MDAPAMQADHAPPRVGATQRHETVAARTPRDNGRLPLRFEENRGQTDASVRYIARDANETLFLTPTEAALALRDHAASPASVVRMRFEGTAGAKSLIAEDPSETKIHYFVGADAARWHDDVPSFSRVRYRDVYSGVDVVYYGSAGELEYDFVVAPGARADDIDLAFDGADAMHVDRDGDLVLHTGAGDLVQKRPFAYQPNGNQRNQIQARYVRRGKRNIGIALGRYDHRRPLVVDPLVLSYSTYLGGSGMDKVLSLAVDAAGNSYVAGLTQSIDFPVANAAQPANGGSTDVFVSKINASGTALIYSTYLGGSNIDAALGIAKDGAGNAYVTGYTASANFPVTAGAFQPALNGGAYDAFVVKLAPTGSLQYSTYLGGSDIEVANAIAVDGAGNAYVTGFTCSTDFPVMNAFQPLLHGAPYGCFSGWDAFVSKFDASGAALVYSTYFGGFGQDEAKAIAIDSLGRAVITGYTASSDLPIAGLQMTGYNGSKDPFVSRFTTAGWLDYSTYFGGSGDDEGSSIALDGVGDVYVSGLTQSTDFPTANAFQGNLHGPQDAFVAKLAIAAPSSASLIYSSYLGGRSDESGRAIAVDSSGFAYVTGFTESLDFPVVAPIQPMLRGPKDAFVTRVKPDGALAFSTFFGGDDEDDGWGIALGNGIFKGGNSIHIAGTTSSSDLSSANALQPDLQGPLDGFVAKLGFVP